MKTMMNVISRAGATLTSLRISAAISPASSATPTPIMATKMTATTLKFAKLLTNEVKMKRSPSTVSRLLISVVSVWISTSGSSYEGGALDLGLRRAAEYSSSAPRSAAARRPRR